jgi:hypothetical protein
MFELPSFPADRDQSIYRTEEELALGTFLLDLISGWDWSIRLDNPEWGPETWTWWRIVRVLEGQLARGYLRV